MFGVEGGARLIQNRWVGIFCLAHQAREMTHNSHSAQSRVYIDPTGKRASPRYPLDLHAFIRGSGDIRLPCVIRNFCIGGMFLSYRQSASLAAMAQGDFPAAGDIIAIHCVVPAERQSNRLQFQARVVRSFEGGVGVAFINPNLAALQIMQDFSLPSGAVAPIAQLGADAGIAGNMKAGTIVKECSRVIDSAIDGMIKSVNSKTPGRMFELSRDTKNYKEQNAYFNARDIWKKSAGTLAGLFRAAVHKRLINISPVKMKVQSDKKDLPMPELSLIKDEDLSEWLSVSDINNSVESRYKKLLVAIEQRLSRVFNVPVGKDNNPYGPALFTESFLSAIKNFGMEPLANAVCLAVFKDVLVEKSSDLYQKLDAVLVDGGVLLDLKPKVVRENTPPRPFVSEPGVAPKVKESAGAEGRNLYQVANEIRKLRDEIARQSEVPSSSQSNERPLHPDVQALPLTPTQTYTVSDVISALAHLQTDHEMQITTNHESKNIKLRVLSALESINPEGDNKEISPHDSSVMEVAGDLFHAIQGDSLVADSVRPWLKRLELPILRLTLEDNTVFLDRSNVARQVLNKIAQLEIHDNEHTSSNQSAIKDTIDRLIDRINKEFNGTTEIFEKILVQLERLTQIQDKAYSENVNDVITACEQNAVIAEVGEEPERDETTLTAAAWDKWLKQARRLKKGDWMLFLNRDDQVQRLRVAWVSESSGIYVFVNSRGLKEKALDTNDLARKMHRGTAIPLDNADDPAMDRAQYAALQELHEQLLYETTHDQLTGLASRREFELMLAKAVVSAQQAGLRHVLCLVNVDRFSAVNNSCGYAGGDKLLKELAALLQKEMDGRGVLARFGGDEFGMLVENATLDDTLAIAEQQIDAVTRYRFEWEDKRFSVALSMGLVPVNARNNSITELLQAAESSCRLAKDVGGNRLQVYHAGHSQLAQRSAVMKWVGKIDEILEKDRLLLYCQRIEPINGDASVQSHFEILLRVVDDQGDILSPHEFIQAAEWYGRMMAVDRWVITKVFKWMADHRDALDDVAAFTINLSGQSIPDDSFTDFILEQMDRAQIPQHKICFEVTETVGISNLSDASAFIMEMKKTGCTFALDDFGSGMSSYAYLKNLPVDLIKIDGVFVKNMEGNSVDYALVKSICEVGHFMNKKVVAEFVENDTILNLLREIGVDYAQGYVIDTPAPLDRLLAAKSIQ